MGGRPPTGSRPLDLGRPSGPVAGGGTVAGPPSLSTERLTKYDNTDLVTNQPDDEIFLYGAATNRLECVSCNRTGPPTAGGAAIRWSAPPDTDAELNNHYPQHNVSDAGQVFFETPEALLPQDTNGQRDVYEYEGGSLYLISGGAGEAGSFFLDATPSGSDVFFATAQSLLSNDTDTAYDIYDARTDGGFVEPAMPPPPCAGEECRGAGTSAPTFSTPSSTTFVGVGNITPLYPSPPKPKTAAQIKAKKFARALKLCRAKRNKYKRVVCESKARKSYDPASKAKKSAKANRRGK